MPLGKDNRIADLGVSDAGQRAGRGNGLPLILSTQQSTAMKTTFFSIILCFFATTTFSQTKKIAFESHSGKASDFATALTNDLFDDDGSDFGLPSDKYVHKVDKLIYLNDSTLLISSKEYLRPWRATNDSLDRFQRNGTDTMFLNMKITRQISADSLIRLLKGMYGEYESAPKMKMVGFDNGDSSKKLKPSPKPTEKQELIPLPLPVDNDRPDNHSPFDSTLTIMLLSILGLSLLGGFISWKLYKPKLASI